MAQAVVCALTAYLLFRLLYPAISALLPGGQQSVSWSVTATELRLGGQTVDRDTIKMVHCWPGRDALGLSLIHISIREHAEQRVFGNLGILTHSKKENPEQVIALCGCMAQEERVAKRIKESYRHVDLVFGPHALWRFPELLWQVYETGKRVFAVDDEHGSIAEGIPVVREKGVKAWVSIMYGCNNFCSYCIVPYVRGRERSRDPVSYTHLDVYKRQVLSFVNRDFTILALTGFISTKTNKISPFFHE